MTSEKPTKRILVGDDKIDLAQKVFPDIPNTDVEFIDDHEEVMRKGTTEDYSMVVTDLKYTPPGEEGFLVLYKLKETPSR